MIARVQTGSNGFPSRSSIDLSNKTTTTSGSEVSNDNATPLNAEWLSVDTTSLADIGFSQAHLIQVIRHGNLTASEVQDSINFFSFDLKRNEKAKGIKGPPLNFFMGILRKGLPYTPPENYESAVDEARRKRQEFLERKDRERQAVEQRIFELEFAEWKRGLSADQIIGLVPEFARRPGPIQESSLKSHFEGQIWPERQRQIEQSAEDGL